MQPERAGRVQIKISAPHRISISVRLAELAHRGKSFQARKPQ